MAGAVNREDAPSDVALGVRAVVAAVCTPLLLRLDLTRLQRVLEPRRTARPDDQAATARRVCDVADRATARAGRLVRPGCLARSVGRYAALRRAGVDVSLCFGMGTPGDRLEGHCWLVLDGERVFEPDDDTPAFTEFVRISGAGLSR
jgi:hypothetical protein